MKKENLKEGTYLRFFHGRKTVEEEMDDWGTEGPVIGPVTIGFTYGGMTIVHDTDGEETDLVYNIKEGMVHIGDTYYGDFHTFSVTKSSPMNKQDMYHYIEFADFKRLNEPTYHKHIDAIGQLLTICGQQHSKPMQVYRELCSIEHRYWWHAQALHEGKITKKELKDAAGEASRSIQKRFGGKLEGLKFLDFPESYCILLEMNSQYKDTGLFVDGNGYGILAVNENDLKKTA